MGSDTQGDIALSLKKRARRRLVGAIALVIVMLIILPNILRENVDETQEPIAITMYETEVEVEPQPIDGMLEADEQVLTPSSESAMDDASEFEITNDSAVTIISDVPVAKVAEKPVVKTPEIKQKKAEEVKVVAEVAPKEQIEKKVVNNREAEIKKEKLNTLKAALAAEALSNVKKSKAITTQDEKAVSKKKAESPYLIQVGVFSEAPNVARLQAKIKKLGYASNTSKIKTSKGEMIRLRVNNFSSRALANKALDKLKRNGLSGMVLKRD